MNPGPVPWCEWGCHELIADERSEVERIRAAVNAAIARTPCVVVYLDKSRTCGNCVICKVRAAINSGGVTT